MHARPGLKVSLKYVSFNQSEHLKLIDPIWRLEWGLVSWSARPGAADTRDH